MIPNADSYEETTTIYKENLRTKFILGAEPTNTTRTMQMRIPHSKRNTKVKINPVINVY